MQLELQIFPHPIEIKYSVGKSKIEMYLTWLKNAPTQQDLIKIVYIKHFDKP